MAKCVKIRRKTRKICIGDLNKEIKIQDRAIAEPLFNTVDFDETFTDNATVWASVNTVSGKTFFDGVNSDVNITHEIFIRYDVTVTTESWVELSGRRIDILKVEDLEERNEFMRLICTERGANTFEATKA